MFYSHEILTSRKHGVATIWLVATLGQKSSLKTVGRKAILDVNVPKACESILKPEAPLALRLQGNLLYGLSRVFARQCSYMLADAQTAQSAMRELLNSVRAGDIDMNTGSDAAAAKLRRHPELLLLRDDPYFMLDVDLPAIKFGLEYGLPSVDELLSQDFSVRTKSTQSMSQDRNIGENLILPSDSSQGQIGGFVLTGVDSHTGSHLRPSSVLGHDDEVRLLPEDFGFDEEGNILEFDTATGPAVVGFNMPTLASDRAASDKAASAQVRQEHAEGQQLVADGGSRPFEYRMNLDLPQDYDEHLHLEEDTFPSIESVSYRPASPPGVTPMDEEDEDRVGVPILRRHRIPKTIVLDTTIELRNRDLLEWNSQYVRNMKAAQREKLIQKMPTQAKKNADYWILGVGINGVGEGLGSSKVPSTTLTGFSGEALYELITGVDITIKRRKRVRAESEEDTESGRNVRSRHEEEGKIGRDDAIEHEVTDVPAFIKDDDGDDVERARHASDGLEDVSSAVPWNTTTSLRGSSIPRGVGSITGFPSAGGPSSATGLPGSVGRSTSRIISPSPLMGRGRPSGLEIATDGGRQGGSPQDDEGLGIFFDSQIHATMQSTRLTDRQQDAAPETESTKFLLFLEQAIQEKQIQHQTEVEGHDQSEVMSTVSGKIGFLELFPPASSSYLVGARALLQVLTLATKNLMRVSQEEDYGEIWMRV